MIVARVSQAFFDFIAMACFASVASFQAKWDVGPCTLQASFTPSVSLAHRVGHLQLVCLGSPSSYQ